MSTNRRKQQARQRGARQRAERQARRERAAELFAQGRSQAEVARELDVSRQSASRWHAGWQAEGATALQSRGPTGRRPKVPDAALEPIQQVLLEGALAHGFATDVWTLDRIAVVIQGLTGDGLGYIAKVTLPYLVIMVLFTLVITAFPGIALFLPNMLAGR